MKKYQKINSLFRLSYCLLALFLLLSPAQAQVDPFKPQTDFAIDTGPPGDPLNASPAKPRGNPFKISLQAIPDKVSPGQSFIIQTRFDIAPGHQLYAKETSLSAPQADSFTFEAFRSLTPASEKNDPYLGKVLIYKKAAILELPVTVADDAGLGPKTLSLKVRYLGCTETTCFLPETKEMAVSFAVVSEAEAGDSLLQTESPVSASPIPEPRNALQKAADRFGLLGVLVAAFIWGFLASLTPCVYPMIPVTISVIGAGSHGSTSRGFVLSLFYVLGMSLTYAIFGTIAAWSGSMFGEYANHPAVRITVASVFVILGLSMFDLFYLQVPSAISSKLGGRKGSGIIGVFLTGAAAGAVVGPCVGPMLVALLVYIAAIGSKLQGFFIMWHFALGMGMLFLAIGTFSGAAASLPKAGGWMEKLKRFFGVLMLAIALFYVEPLIPERIFVLLIGALLIGVGIFVKALDPLTSESTERDRFWKAIGILVLAVGIGYAAKFTLMSGIEREPIPSRQETGISWMSDEASALLQAKTLDKPVMLDFSAEWCAACKKLERETFTDPGIIELSKSFVCARIDATNASAPGIRQLQKKYQVVGLPTIIFMTPDAQVLQDSTITQFVGPDTLLRQMRQAKAGG